MGVRPVRSRLVSNHSRRHLMKSSTPQVLLLRCMRRQPYTSQSSRYTVQDILGGGRWWAHCRLRHAAAERAGDQHRRKGGDGLCQSQSVAVGRSQSQSVAVTHRLTHPLNHPCTGLLTHSPSPSPTCRKRRKTGCLLRRKSSSPCRPAKARIGCAPALSHHTPRPPLEVRVKSRKTPCHTHYNVPQNAPHNAPP